MTKISRRSFLKLMGAIAPAVLMPSAFSWLDKNLRLGVPSKPNVIIFVFDAMSARNLSVYGYPRQTAPNLERFAERANVYHSHHSGGNYTIPGTASLLTGTYPWTHRAINYSGVVKRSLVENNIFRTLGDDYHRLAFPQNIWSSFIVSQFDADIDTFLPSDTFGENNSLLGNYFPRDRNLAIRALDDFVFKIGGPPVALILQSLKNASYSRETALLDSQGYPRGLPHVINYPLYFRLENLLSGLAALLPKQPSPFFAYLHLFPPHAPYRPSRKFNKYFVSDGFVPVDKPAHRLSDHLSQSVLDVARRSYDQYIASLDEEFGKLMDKMEKAGILENSYVVVTSDHGEMFERGEKNHETPLLYEPIIHVPLLISSPGQKIRHDVYSPTNAVDLLPTFASLAGTPIPSWSEGKPLPGLGGVEDLDRATFTVEAKLSSAFGPLHKATVAMRKGNHKLIYYTGYEAEETFELYDMENDPEELDDLYPSEPSFAKQLRKELLESFLAADKSYRK
ncbi:MAG: sulfatase-like hydrolase/transferase [Chloroflexi bacterium]|nr:sulfatase-like hydrolase/transferase [Chloroflexota bacterium]